MDFSKKKFRHEQKYYINYLEMIPLRAKVRALLPMDKNSVDENGYYIRSLYFDGMHDHALYDKNDGIFGREKFRIRCYNASDAVIKLERKSKYGDFISKESAPLSRSDYDAIMEGRYDILRDRAEPLVQDFYMALQYRLYKPRVIVEYLREAYIYEPGNVRITLDKELQGSINGMDLFDDRIIYESTLNDKEQVILEVKFDQFLPDVIRQLVQPERFVRSTISKYVLCRERRIQYYK